MKNLEILIQKIQKSNLSIEDKNELITLLEDKNTDYSIFIVTVLKTLGLAADVFKKFDIDIGELIDKI